jgi:ABC-type nickel/cobalt efflux system permease component RcnA
LRERIIAMARRSRSPGTLALLLLFCFGWGATHAFAPGHGKAIAGTYLVSSGASYRHAVLLGALVTLTHTGVVLILAAASLALGERFTYPAWLQPVGAVLILLVGLRRLLQGLRQALGGESHRHDHHGHSHPHSHSHDHKAPHTHTPASGHATSSVSMRDVGAVGLSGGMVPCPASIVLLLLLWQLGMPVIGFLAITAFSLGLAMTLVGVGMLAVSGTQMILRWVRRGDKEHAHYALVAVPSVVGGLLLLVFGAIMLFGR